jgi:WD40 repeat protein
VNALGSGSGARTALAERLALLYREAGNPPLKRVSEAVVRLQRVDERGRPVRVSVQRISDWRRARNVPAQFTVLAAVLQVLIPDARRAQPTPVSEGLYDLAQWQLLWERAVADPPAGERPGAEAEDGGTAEAAALSGVCPYRGLAPYRREDARWFFGRERSTDALVAQLRAASTTGGLVVLVGASGAGKSSLLNAGLVPALRGGALGTDADATARPRAPKVPGTPDTPQTSDAPQISETPQASDLPRTPEVLQLVPGATPLAELAARIPDLAPLIAVGPDADTPAFGDAVREAVSAWAEREAPAAARPVIIVDQFEETFTLCPEETDRRTFVHVLHALCTPGGTTPAGAAPDGAAPDGAAPGEATPSRRPTTAPAPAPAPARVVLGIRADFYEHCLRHPELADALQHRHMVLGPLTSAELREAVTAPARAAGLELEPGLTELILREVSADGPRGTHHAGVLPLLSHALLATWQRRKAGRLTLAGYRAAGGIQGAVAATAERAWSRLDPAARTAARLLLLRLVRLGEDTQATRRRGTRRRLAAESADPGKTEESLEALVRARLVTLDADTVEITHEALLHAWPRLREWIDEDRKGHLLRQRIEEDGRSWEDSGRDTALLYRGSRLDQARSWAHSAQPAAKPGRAPARTGGTGAVGGTGAAGTSGTGGAAGGDTGGTVLTRSATEFLTASLRLRRRTVWISRSAVAALVVLAVLAAWTAVVARQQRDEAVFQQVLAEADRVQYTDPSLSAQLDLVAHRLRPDDEGTHDRLVSIVNAPLATPLLGHTGAVYLTTFSPDGHTLATASYDRTVRLWDVTDPTRPKPLGKPLTGHTSWVSTAVFSPDGRTLASASDDGTVRLWDVTAPARPRPLGAPLDGHDGTIYLLAFSPDGRALAAATQNRVVRLWNTADPRRPAPLGKLTGHTSAVRSVAFTPDGRTLAAGGDDNTVLLWNVGDPRRPARTGTALTGHTGTVHSVAFTPDGRTLASGSADDTIRLWNVTDPHRPTALGAPLTGHTGPVWSVAFDHDGGMLAAGSADSTASLWNVANPAYPSQVGEPLAGSSGEMYAVGFSPDGRTLATGTGDNKVRLWSIPTSDMIGRIGAFRPDGRVLATAARDGRVRLWDVTDPSRPVPLGRPFMPGEGDLRSVVFSPDGRTLAALTGGSAVQLWNVADPARPVPWAPPVTLPTRFAGPDALAISPDGRVLATAAGHDRAVQLWNATDPARLRPLGKPLTGHTGYVHALVFSPDGRTLASGSADTTVRLWNVTDPRHAIRVGAPLRGHLGPVNILAYSPDGATLAGGSDDGTVRLWDVTEPGAPSRLATLGGHTEAVVSLTFGRDGRTLASGGNDDTVRLWDVSAPSRTSPIGQSMSPNAKTGNFLSFSPASHLLGVSSGADTVRLWNLDPEAAAEHICATTRGVLTPQKWHEYLPRLPYDPPCPR